MVEEFTLLLCVTPKDLADTVQGGETLIFPYASKEGVAFDTVTPGNGVIFRKDLEHAGGILKAGEKHILTANVWATRKQISDQVLFVTFQATPDEEKEEGKPPSSPEAVLQEVASQGNSYALPVDSLRGTMLEAHVRFVNQGYEQEDEEPPKVITYACSDFTYEEFGTVAKILLRSYVQEDEIKKHADALDYFGPFAAENLLVNMAVEQDKTKPPVGSEEKSCKSFVQPTDVQDLHAEGKGLAKRVKSDLPADQDTDDYGVIVCENESRTKVVYDVARTLGFNNYVPFKMIFVQGIFLHGYYDGRVKVPVTPAALVVGDYNHVFAIQNIGGQRSTIKPITLEEYHSKHNFFSSNDKPGWDAKKGTLFETDEGEEGWYDWDANYEAMYNFRKKPRGLGLKQALGNDKNASEILSAYVLQNAESENHNGGADPTFFQPLSKFVGQSSSATASAPSEAGNGDSGDSKGLFHRDTSGMATFTEEEAEAASNYIASMNLDERIKASKFSPICWAYLSLLSSTCKLISYHGRNTFRFVVFIYVYI